MYSIRWRGSGDVRSLTGKMVALQFSFLPEDKLYSYTLRAASRPRLLAEL